MEIITRLSRFFPDQFRRPTGLLGQVVMWYESRRNEAANDFTLAALEVNRGDRVLEAGFGPGVSLQKLREMSGSGPIIGVDYSGEMVVQARRRNGRAIQNGQVILTLGDVCALPLPAGSIDKILAVSVIYFLEDLPGCLRELLRVLKPGGRIAFYMTSKQDLLQVEFTQIGNFHLYEAGELVELLQQVGFGRAWYLTREIHSRTGVCVLAEKPGR